MEAVGRMSLAGETGVGPSAKLVEAAHEFEGQLMKELLGPLTAGGAPGDDGGDDSEAGSSGALGEFAAEALGQSLSSRGGFGIADRIMRELTRPGNQCHGEKVIPARHKNTVVRDSGGLK